MADSPSLVGFIVSYHTAPRIIKFVFLRSICDFECLKGIFPMKE